MCMVNESLQFCTGLPFRLLNLPGPTCTADGGVHKLAGFSTGHHLPGLHVPVSDNEAIDSQQYKIPRTGFRFVSQHCPVYILQKVCCLWAKASFLTAKFSQDSASVSGKLNAVLLTDRQTNPKTQINRYIHIIAPISVCQCVVHGKARRQNILHKCPTVQKTLIASNT